MSKRPIEPNDQLDPLSDAIDALHLVARAGGTFDLEPPFALQLKARPGVDLAMLVVLRGTAAISIVGERAAPRIVSAGDLVIRTRIEPIELRDSPISRAPVRQLASCPRLVAVTPERDRGTTARFLSLGFSISPLAKNGLLAELPLLLVARPDASPTLATAAALFRSEATSPTGGSRALLGRLGEAIFIDILRREGHREKDRCGELRAFADPPLARALARVHAEPARAWTLASLGRIAGLSRSAFAARFHAQVGEPALHYITRWRMRRAAELLLDSAACIPEVAHQVGYRSEASFTRAFVRAIGKTPGRFRRAERRSKTN